MTIEQAVVFVILMENDDGILGKAPIYIREKLDAAQSFENPEILLDQNNYSKFIAWKERWTQRDSR